MTDSQGILYTILDSGENTLKVDADNSARFRATKKAITIPATVISNGVTYTVTQIDRGAFKQTAITSANILTPVTAIPANLFQGSTNLTSVEYPTTVTSIGSSAFEGCTSLVCPTLHEGLTSIGGNAFKGCTEIGDVAFPSTIKTIGTYAFANACVTSIDWPSTHDGNLAIYTHCFDNGCDIATLTFPSYVTSIGSYAFHNAKINRVDMSSMPEATKISDYAFNGCTATQIILPNKVEEIGAAAFLGCKSMTQVRLPKNGITTCGNSIFKDCTALKSVSYMSALKTIPNSFFYNCSSLSNISLGSSTTVIDEEAFRKCTSLKTITLPMGLKEIGVRAFFESGLTEITLPVTITTVADYAFSSSDLETVSFTSDNTFPTFGYEVFSRNNNMTTFTFPKYMTVIPEGFLKECSNLKTLINFTPAQVNREAFYRCYNLELGTLPETLHAVGDLAFTRCGKDLADGIYFLDNLEVKESMTMGKSAFNAAKIRSLDITAGDQYLEDPEKFGDNAIANMTASSIVFPKNMKRIPNGICRGWSKLTFENITWPEAVTALGDYAFDGCTSLNLGDFNFEGEFPWNQIKDYGKYSLANTGITSIKWPATGDGYTIGEGLFAQNSKLTKANIPCWMNDIPASLFDRCIGVTDIVWETGRNNKAVINVGNYAFSSLRSLNEIKFPTASAINLGKYAFTGCSKATFKWPSSTSPLALGIGSFSFCKSLRITGFPNYITEVPDHCFEGCSAIVNITFPERITKVGEYAFADATSLTRAAVNANITSLNAYVFDGCTSLATVRFRHSLNSISSDAFRNCTALTNLTFADDQQEFQSLWSESFENCSSLENFLYDGVGANTELGKKTFFGCSSMKAMNLPASQNMPEFLNNTNVSLQAVNFKSNGTFGTTAPDVNIPLLGVSTQPVKLTALPTKLSASVKEREKKGVLMVAHGDRWKYEEAGYGKIWDIREYRATSTELSGTIHSDFKKGDVRNKYTAYLSWVIDYSDLNPEGPTQYYVYRRGNTETQPTRVAELTFVKPEIVEGVNDMNVVTSEPLIRCVITKFDSQGHGGFGAKEIDFDYEVSKDYYMMVHCNQHPNLYFDPQTTRRVGASEQMDDKSRLLFLDEFDSPKLDGSEGTVPDYYEYYVVVSGFEYDEPVNNENYAIGEDGLAYHFEKKTRQGFTSEICRVYVPTALPWLQYNGIYTTEQIEGDTEGTLQESKLYNDKGEVTLNYSYHPDILRHRMLHGETGTTDDWVVNKVSIYRVDNDNEQNLGSYVVDHSNPYGIISTSAVQPNTTFQMITETTGRGTFGSRSVHVYGAPQVTLSADPFAQVDGDHNHWQTSFYTDLFLNPDVEDMGYTGKNRLNATNHRVGVWRSTTIETPDAPAAAPRRVVESTPEVLVNHTGGPVEETFYNDCETCTAMRGYLPDALVYTDVIGAQGEYGAKLKANYRTRLYVQLPDDPYHWMIAEASASPSNDITNGIDRIFDGQKPTDAIYYNLQGCRVINPQPGEILIMTTPNGNYKIRY